MGIFKTKLSLDYFEPIERTVDYFRWQDLDTKRVRILAESKNPFDKPVVIVPRLIKNKSDRTDYISYLQIKIKAIEPKTPLPLVILNRRYVKSHFPSSNDCLFSASFQAKDPLHWIIYEILPIQKQLYLIRGASGSGKTTLGQALAVNRVISADDFPNLYQDRVYQTELQKQSHAWCLEQTEINLKTGYNVAVANTFSRKKHLQPYLELANRYNYRVSIITCEGNHGNVHGVTEEIRNRQLATFEPIESLGINGLEMRLTDAIKNQEITPQQLHEMIDKIEQNLPKPVLSITPVPPKPTLKRASDSHSTGEFNEQKTNEQRMQESIQLATEAVDFLKKNGQWHSNLTKRQRIALIQKYTQEYYDRTISSGTLYRDWCKGIWE